MRQAGILDWPPGIIIGGMCAFFLVWSIDVVFRTKDERVLYFTGSCVIFLALTIIALKDII